MLLKKSKRSLYSILSTIALAAILSCMVPAIAHASATLGVLGSDSIRLTSAKTKGYTPPTSDTCGGMVDGQDESVNISINIGCKHIGNPIMDATFAIIRFLSDGVGLVIVASLIWAGIQYTGSRGDPQSTALAVKRIRSNVLALFVFIFAYALLNYIVPGQILQ